MKLGTIHLGRWQIFYNFCPLPLSRRQFFITIRWQISDPLPLKVPNVHSQLFSRIDAFLQKSCHFPVT